MSNINKFNEKSAPIDPVKVGEAMMDPVFALPKVKNPGAVYVNGEGVLSSEMGRIAARTVLEYDLPPGTPIYMMGGKKPWGSPFDLLQVPLMLKAGIGLPHLFDRESDTMERAFRRELRANGVDGDKYRIVKGTRGKNASQNMQEAARLGLGQHGGVLLIDLPHLLKRMGGAYRKYVNENAAIGYVPAWQPKLRVTPETWRDSTLFHGLIRHEHAKTSLPTPETAPYAGFFSPFRPDVERLAISIHNHAQENPHLRVRRDLGI